jgi:hypothetical protein
MGVAQGTGLPRLSDAILRQINKDVPRVYHDALEFPDGTFVLLTDSAGTRSLGAR